MRPVEIARRISASRYPVAACARVLGIPVRRYCRPLYEPPGTFLPMDFECASSIGGIHIPTRSIYLCDVGIPTNIGVRPRPRDALHELMHALCDPPEEIAEYLGVGSGLCATEETWILIQVERAYGKAILPLLDYGELLESQGDYHIDVDDTGGWDPEYEGLTLGEVDLRRIPWWREGYNIARRVGLLDGNRRPTFRKPDWGKL